MHKKRLGRGLASLLDTTSYVKETNTPSSQFQLMDIEDIECNTEQPRKYFDEHKLYELRDSIKHNGILQPIIVHRTHSHRYEIIAGERRWRAAKLAGLAEVPVIIAQYNPNEAMELSIIENIQRENLNPIEESDAYSKLVENFGYSQKTISERIGKSRSYVANMLRLKKLPLKVQNLIITGEITYGHAKVLIGVKDIDKIVEKIVNNNLNVRQVEQYVQKLQDRSLENNKSANSHCKKNSLDIQQENIVKEHKEDVITENASLQNLTEDEINEIKELNAISQTLTDTFNAQIQIKKNPKNQRYIMTWDISNLNELDSILNKI